MTISNYCNWPNYLLTLIPIAAKAAPTDSVTSQIQSPGLITRNLKMGIGSQGMMYCVCIDKAGIVGIALVASEEKRG